MIAIAGRSGLFIALEGMSGSGKSTLVALLAQKLGGRHFHTVPAPATCSPTSTRHAAVHDLPNDTVAAVIAPFTSYLAVPDLTVYLHTSPRELTRRMRAKPDQTRSDHDLLADPALLQRLQDHYDQIAATDPSARHLHTTGRSPAELAGLIAAMLPVPMPA